MSDELLLAGASGELGGRIAARLLSKGVTLHAMSRRPDALATLASSGARIVSADLMDPASLDRVMDVRQVVTTANGFIGRGESGPKRIDHTGNRNLIDAAKRAGVEHFVFVSANVPDAFRKIDYFRIKAETEAYLQASGLRHTILRPTAFLETWGRIVGDSIRDKNTAPVFGAGDRKMNYIAIEDVAAVVVELVAAVPPQNQVVEIGGPDNITAHELIDVLAGVLNRDPARRTVPLFVLRLLGVFAGLVNPVEGRKMKTAYATATSAEAFDFERVKDRFPIHWTTVAEWARFNYEASL